MKRLWIFGDSILRGVTYDDERKTHLLCKGYKLEKLAALGYEIKNRSRMGATVKQGYEAFQYDKDNIQPEDTVLFEYGGNDCDFAWAEVAADSKGHYEPHVALETYLTIYGKMAEEAKEKGAEVCMATLLPIEATKYFDWISHDKNADAIREWLGDVEQLYRWQESYALAAERLCEKKMCRKVDLREAFLLRRDFPALISADGIHPTNKGHDLIEDTLCQALG